ncbi:MAG: hypothetical protein HEQ19_28235 [Gloeotrichia echinulata CP02]
MERRNIPLDLVESVLDNPQQIFLEREGKINYGRIARTQTISGCW